VSNAVDLEFTEPEMIAAIGRYDIALNIAPPTAEDYDEVRQAFADWIFGERTVNEEFRLTYTIMNDIEADGKPTYVLYRHDGIDSYRMAQNRDRSVLERAIAHLEQKP
jgi:hypothetical protein